MSSANSIDKVTENVERTDDVRILLDCENCKGCESSNYHEFHGSRKNLCKESSYFQSMFNSGFAESQSDTIKMSGICAAALDALIKWSNGIIRSLKYKFEHENLDVYQVLQASAMLLCDVPLKNCCDFLVSIMSVSNACKVLKMSEIYVIEDLFNKTLRFILWSFDNYKFEGEFVDAEFLKLPLKLLKMIVGNVNLKIRSELRVFQAISAWVNHDSQNRRKYFQTLIQCVNSCSLTDNEWAIIYECPELSILKSLQDVNTTKRFVPWLPCCVGRYKNEPYVFIYDETDVLNPLKPFLSLVGKASDKNGTTANGFQVASTGRYLFIIGGEFGFGRSNWNTKIWKYDIILEKWEDIMELQTTRRHHVLASSEEAVYIIGGFGKHRVLLHLVEKIHGQQIVNLPPLPNPVYNVASFYYDDKLHVFKDSRNVWILDGKQWTRAWMSMDDSNFEFHSVLPYQKDFYFTCKYSSSLHKTSLRKNLNSEIQNSGMKWTFTPAELIGKFQNEAQNVCLVDGKIYNFYQIYNFSPIGVEERSSMVEVYDIANREFKVLFESKNEEEIDFSHYSISFGVVKYPYRKFPVDT